MPWCFCSGTALDRRLYLRDNNSGLSVDGTVKRVMDLGGETGTSFVFFFPREGNSVGPFTVTSNGIFYYYSCFGEADSTMNLLSMFSTQIVFISLFFCICLLSPFPFPDFPAAKPWGPSLRVPVSQFHLFPWHFSPIPFPAWQGSVLQMPLEGSEITSAFCIRQEIANSSSNSDPLSWLLSAAGTFRGVQSMLCCCFPGEPDFGSGQLLFTLCAEAAPCLLLLVWWFYFCLIFSSSYNLLAGLELARC